MLLDLRSLLEARSAALTPDVGVLSAAGQPAIIGPAVMPLTGRLRLKMFLGEVMPATGVLTLAEYAGSTLLAVAIIPAQGAITLVGFAPALDEAISPSIGALSLVGQTPGVLRETFLAPAQGVLDLVGQLATIEASSGASRTPSAGALVLASDAPSTLVDTRLAVLAAALTLTGTAPTIDAGAGASLTPSAGALQLVAAAPTVVIPSDTALTPSSGVLVASATAPEIQATGPAQITPDSGALTITGLTPAVDGTKPLGPIPMRRISTKGIRWIKVPIGSPRPEPVEPAMAAPVLAEAPTFYEAFAITPDTGSVVASGIAPLSEPDVRIAPKPMREPAFGVVTLRSEFVQRGARQNGELVSVAPVSIGEEPTRRDSAITPMTGSLMATGRTGDLTLGTEGADEARRWFARIVEDEDETLVLEGSLL